MTCCPPKESFYTLIGMWLLLWTCTKVGSEAEKHSLERFEESFSLENIPVRWG